MFLELKPKGMYLSSEKEKENGFLVYRSTKREARTFDVLVMQSIEQKCLQNYYFFFKPASGYRRRRCFESTFTTVRRIRVSSS